jgi:hypothetical protein
LYKVAPGQIFLPVGLIFPVSTILTLPFAHSHRNAAAIRKASRRTLCTVSVSGSTELKTTFVFNFFGFERIKGYLFAVVGSLCALTQLQQQ